MKSIYISLLKSMTGKNLHNQGDLRKKKIIELTSRLTTASTEVELWPKPRNSKKRGFGFLIIKRSIFNIFTNGSKLHCIQVKIVSHKKCYHAAFRHVFALLPKKWSLIFKIKKKRLTRCNHLS